MSVITPKRTNRRGRHHRRGRPPEMIPIEPVKAAFYMSYRPAAMIAEHLGWMVANGKSGPRPDDTRVKRVCGVHPFKDHAGEWKYRTEIELPLAIEMLRAMDCDPVDFGL